jgi:putative hemolysin
MDSENPKQTEAVIDLARGSRNALSRWLLRGLDPLINCLLKHQRINFHAREVMGMDLAGSNFFDNGLKSLGVEYEVREEDLKRIPKTGPVMVVANHPYGGVDGIIMGSLLQKVRPDSKLMVNYLLNKLEGIRPHVIKVDPFGGANAAISNLGPMRESLRWLKNGGLLATWPAGTVSHWHWRQRRVTDPQWTEHVAGVIQKTRATVVPVYFEGRNSLLFQIAGLIHPLLRTLLLPREMLRLNGSKIRVHIGNPIGPSKCDKFSGNREIMDFLRLKTYILQNREVAEKVSFRFSRRQRKKADPVPFAAPIEADLLEREVNHLGADQLLAEHNEFRIFCARAKDIPLVLKEIGRLREVTFRAVGEGTGLARDLDRFDDYYLHLFMWNSAEREVAGAYRLGLTDEILRNQGESGLYTTTLFRYKPGVLDRLNPAVELGRSFITAKYQKKPLSLGLIWKGIGKFISQNPRYRILFGPVSISKEYQTLSKNMIVMYLKENTLDPDFSSMVKARKPPRSKHLGGLDRYSFNTTVRDIEDVSALISEIEREERGVPVLLRQYLKLNATMLSFNVDPEFNDCIDGLVLVDLVKTNEKTLRRYMGDEGAERFYAYHEVRVGERETLNTSD